MSGERLKGREAMSVQRVPAVPFAQIANGALRDRRLSFKARGVLAMVLSNVGEWEATARWLESQSDKDGAHAIQSALNELTELGYRVVTYERDNQGRLHASALWFHEPTEISRPSENPPIGKPAQWETDPAIEHHPQEHHLEEHYGDAPDLAEDSAVDDSSSSVRLLKTKSAPRKRPTDEELEGFDEFWETYPRKVRKVASRDAYATALTKATPAVLIAGARRYAATPGLEERFTAHPVTWLNQERWTDEIPEPITVPDGWDVRPDGVQVDPCGRLWSADGYAL
jgi:hypothetical protein